MSEERPSDRVLADWGRLSERSHPVPLVRREAIRSRRPASVSAALLATVVIGVALAGVALVNRGTGPATTLQPSPRGPSAIAVQPSVPVAPSPSIQPARLPGADVHAGALITALDGWALLNDGAGTLLTTHDGGASWAPTVQPGPGERIVGVAFADPLHGWVIGDTYPTQGASGILTVDVHRTDDGGATWETVELASLPSPGPDATVGFPTFSVLSADTVFVMLALPDAPGYVSRFYVTSDGGRTWERRAGVTESQRFAFIDETDGWAIRGDREVLVRTVDGGRSWQRASIPTAPGTGLSGYYPTIPVPTRDGRLVMTLESGRDGDPVRIATSDDGGVTWSAPRPAPAGSTGSIAVLGDGTWFLGGMPPHRSADGGASWEAVAAVPLAGVGGVTVAAGSHLSTFVARRDCPPGADCYIPSDFWISDDAGATWRNATP